MMQQWLHFVLISALALIASLGCNRMEPETQSAQDIEVFAFPRLETSEDVQGAVDVATSNTNAILLVHVDWAPMVQQQNRLAEFRREYYTRYSTSDLAFAYIDCTPVTEGYEPLRTLSGWKELEELNGGSSLVHGYGELVWCKNGRVLHVERPQNFDSVDALIAKTESLGIGGIVE